MYDLIYFGNDHNSSQLEGKFVRDVGIEFPNAILKNAYDSIKGYRQSVELPEEQQEDFQVWLIGNGWMGISFNLQSMARDKDKYIELLRIVSLAKERYPENEIFKREDFKNALLDVYQRFYIIMNNYLNPNKPQN